MALPTDVDQIAADNWNEYVRCRDAGHNDYVEQALLFDRYYSDDQWEPEDRARLNAVKRPALTLNVIKTSVNALLGAQIKQRAEITLRPKRHTTVELADVHTRLMHHILETNRYRYKETQLFADGVIQDRGYFNVFMDFSKQIQGEAAIETLDPTDVLLEPEAKEYDPDTWNEVIITRWLTLDDIAVMYGEDKAKQLESLAGMGHTYGADSMLTGAENSFGDPNDPGLYAAPSDGDVTRVTRRVRVLDRQHRVLTKTQFFVDPRTGDMREVPDWPKDRIAQFVAQFSLEIISRNTRRIRWTVTADQVLLHDKWSPYEFFTVVPFFPHFRRGKPTGVVRSLVDPQDQYNKISSQELHVVNTTANSGWMVESGSLVNMTEAELEQRGAETGLVIVVRPGAKFPEKIQPNQIPTGLDRIAAKAKSDLREISGVEALLGQASPQVSGVAITHKQQQAMVIAQVAFDNLNYTRLLLAQRIMSLVQRFYTEPRVYYITMWDQPKKPVAVMAVNHPDPSGQIVNDLTVGEYDISVAIAPSRDTFDDTQFAEAIELRSAGVLVPDDVVIEYSHLSRRDDIAERVRKQMGAEPPTPEEVQVQQMQMQMQMDHAQAELDELKAKAQNLAAQAELAQAKAQVASQQVEGAATVEGAKMQLAHQQLQVEIVAKLAELQNKIDLAKLHTTAKVVTTNMQNTHAAELAAMKNRLAAKPPVKPTKGKTQ